MFLILIRFQQSGELMININKVHYSSAEQGPIKGEVTVIMQHKEAAGAEVAVKFDEDLIGGGGHALLYGAAAELTNLGRGLVRSIPDAGRRRESGGIERGRGRSTKGK